MKKTILSLLFLVSITVSYAQNVMHKKSVDAFSLNYNNNDFEKIYQSFSIKMKNAHTKKYYIGLLSKVKKEYGALKSLELLNYLEGSKNKVRGEYNGNFENGNLTIKITTNGENEIIGLYILKGTTYI